MLDAAQLWPERLVELQVHANAANGIPIEVEIQIKNEIMRHGNHRPWSARGWLGLALSLAGILAAGVARAETPEGEDAAEADADQAPAEVAETLVDNPPPVLPGNPYAAIVARNAFRLKDPVPLPPPPPPAPPTPEVPKVDVKIAGLGEISGVRYAYLMLPDTERAGQFVYPALTDNPQKGRVRHGSGLEVREIDIKKQTVRLVNGGIEATLNLKEHGVKAAPAPAAPGAKPGAAPGTPGANAARVVGAPPTPGVNPANAGNHAAAEPIVFSRNPNRASTGANSPHVTTRDVGMNTIPTVNTGGSIPNRPVRTDVISTPGTGGNNAAPTPSLPVSQQYEVLIRQRQAAESVGIQLPPIPGVPTPTDPGGPE